MNLKNCPFCGSEKLRISKDFKFSKKTHKIESIFIEVLCMNCTADGPIAAYVEEMVEAWNNRASSDYGTYVSK